jgi:hypothetical protein
MSTRAARVRAPHTDPPDSSGEDRHNLPKETRIKGTFLLKRLLDAQLCELHDAGSELLVGTTDRRPAFFRNAGESGKAAYGVTYGQA